MGWQVFEELAVFDVPDADTFVHGTAREEVSCRVEAETEDIVCVASENFYTFSLQKPLAMVLGSGEEQSRRSIIAQSCRLSRMLINHLSVTMQCH